MKVKRWTKDIDPSTIPDSVLKGERARRNALKRASYSGGVYWKRHNPDTPRCKMYGMHAAPSHARYLSFTESAARSSASTCPAVTRWPVRSILAPVPARLPGPCSSRRALLRILPVGFQNAAQIEQRFRHIGLLRQRLAIQARRPCRAGRPFRTSDRCCRASRGSARPGRSGARGYSSAVSKSEA